MESAPQRLPDVIVLNGISSSGKSTIARELQVLLNRPYLVFGVDTLIDAMPPALEEHEAGLLFHSDGRVDAGTAFTVVEDAWYLGLGAIATAGVGLILDEVFLGGARSQRRLHAALHGLQVRWIAVDCDVRVASLREAARPERRPGMAATQARLVHDGVHYDLRVNNSAQPPSACAAQIRDAVMYVPPASPG